MRTKVTWKNIEIRAYPFGNLDCVVCIDGGIMDGEQDYGWGIDLNVRMFERSEPLAIVHELVAKRSCLSDFVVWNRENLGNSSKINVFGSETA